MSQDSRPGDQCQKTALETEIEEPPPDRATLTLDDSDPDNLLAGVARPRRQLFLDDDPRRAEIFLLRHPDAIWVATVTECVARLSETWDEVHLDHDLGGETYVDSSRIDCGMEVVRWICAHRWERLRSTRFFVHSYNLPAASGMVQCLIEHGYVAEYAPFGINLVDFMSFEEMKTPKWTETERAEPASAFGELLNYSGWFFAEMLARARAEYFRS